MVTYDDAQISRILPLVVTIALIVLMLLIVAFTPFAPTIPPSETQVPPTPAPMVTEPPAIM